MSQTILVEPSTSVTLPHGLELDKLPSLPEQVLNNESRPLFERADSKTSTHPETPHNGFNTDLETSRPGTPVSHFTATESWNFPSINTYRLLAVCLLNFGNGMNDSAFGPLIPAMEAHYHISHFTVSLIFVAIAGGFIFAAALSDSLFSLLGRGRTIMVSTLCLGLAYLAVGFAPRFGLVVASFALTGVGIQLNLAQSNVFTTSLTNATTMLGLLHGSYGLGGTIGPIMATAMLGSGVLWSRYYFILLGMAAFNTAFSGWVFRPTEKEKREKAVQRESELALQRGVAARLRLHEARGAQNEGMNGEDLEEEEHDMLLGNRPMSKWNVAKKSLTNRTTLLVAVFILAYQGAEVNIGGWTVSFLISSRHGDPQKIGYVSAGFWAGVTLGRLLLSPACQRLGERRAVWGVVAASAVFQSLVWSVPSLIGNAIFICMVGFLLGPIYPCTMTVATRLLDRNLHMASLGYVSAFGSIGGAAAPFTTGALAQLKGAWVLHPICIGLYAVMLVCWWLLPKKKQTAE